MCTFNVHQIYVIKIILWPLVFIKYLLRTEAYMYCVTVFYFET